MAFADFKKWYAKVKYYNGDVEDISVRKIKTKDGNQFCPKDYTDFNANVLHSVKTAMNDIEGKEQRYYAWIGRLAGSVEELNNTNKRISWPAWPADILDEPDNTSQDERQQKIASSSILAHRQRAAKQKSNKRATANEYEKFLYNNSLQINSVPEIIDSSEQTTVDSESAAKRCFQDKEKLSVNSESKTVSVTFEEFEHLLNKKMKKMEEKINEKVKKIEGNILASIKEQVSQAYENIILKMEEVLGESSLETAKNDCDWTVALLVGVFGEDAKLMRVYPRKPGLKKFPLGFLMLAQNLYRQRLKDFKYDGDIDEAVKSLPAYLADRALDLQGGRNIASRAKRSKKSNNDNYISKKKQKEAIESAVPSAVLTATAPTSTVPLTSQSPSNVKEKA